MKQKKNSILSRQMVIMAFLFIFFLGSFGLGTVGLRQQIATSAAQARAMERRLVELDRIGSKLTGEIAMALSPVHLEAQNERFQLELRQPRENQVVRVNSETQTRFAQRRWEQVVSVPEETTVSFYAPEKN